MNDRAPHLLPPLLAGEGWRGVLLIVASAKSQSSPSRPPPAHRVRSNATAEQSHD